VHPGALTQTSVPEGIVPARSSRETWDARVAIKMMNAKAWYFSFDACQHGACTSIDVLRAMRVQCDATGT
jgi:hypothetical protein